MSAPDLPGRPLGGLRGPCAGFENLRVLDFTKLLPGPYATQILADLGCRVTKIELPPFPDEARESQDRQRRPVVPHGQLGQGVLSVTSADLPARASPRSGRGGHIIEGFRPGLMDRCGGPGELMALNPRLIAAL